MKRDDKQFAMVLGVVLFSWVTVGIAIGYTLAFYAKPSVTVSFTFVGATPQTVKGLTTAATELLQKKGVLPGFKP
jgi:sorbitol-specific phosphotransferase system component IIC